MFTKTLAVTALAVAPTLASTAVNVYWGQSGTEEQRLRTFCETGSFEYVTVGFINKSPEQDPSGLNYPGSDFSVHCGGDVYKNSNGDPSYLQNRCGRIAADVRYCQSLGKKVLLSIGGDWNPPQANYTISSPPEGEYFADFVWKAFGPYDPSSTTPRPFDDNYIADAGEDEHFVFDGFDFDIEHKFDDQTGYVAMVRRLRYLISQETSKSFLLTAAPECPLSDQWFKMKTIIQEGEFDALFVQFYNNPSCHGVDNNNFDAWVAHLQSTASKDAKVFIGIPGSKDAAGSGYLTPSEVTTLVNKHKNKVAFGGVSIWDVVSGSENCNGQPYYEFVHDLVVGTPALTTSSAAATPTSLPTGCVRYHTVVAGEYCYLIMNAYGLIEAELRELNPSLDGGCSLFPGQQLCVKWGVITTTSTTAVPTTSTTSTSSSSTTQITSSSTSSEEPITTSTVGSTTTSEAESTTTSEAESSTTSEIESTTTSEAESTTTSEVESTTTSEVESTATTEVESSTTSEAESSTTTTSSTSTTPESVPTETPADGEPETSSTSSSATTTSSTTTAAPVETDITEDPEESEEEDPLPSTTTSAVETTSSELPSSTQSVEEISSTTTIDVPSSTPSSEPEEDEECEEDEEEPLPSTTSTPAATTPSSTTAAPVETDITEDPEESDEEEPLPSTTSTSAVELTSSELPSSTQSVEEISSTATTDVPTSTPSSEPEEGEECEEDEDEEEEPTASNSVVETAAPSVTASFTITPSESTTAAVSPSTTESAAPIETVDDGSDDETDSEDLPTPTPNPSFIVSSFLPEDITTSTISWTTSTIYSTTTYTITSCPPTVTKSCSTGQVVTETIAVTTTVCPVTTTAAPTTPEPTSPGGSEEEEEEEKETVTDTEAPQPTATTTPVPGGSDDSNDDEEENGDDVEESTSTAASSWFVGIPSVSTSFTTFTVPAETAVPIVSTGSVKPSTTTTLPPPVVTAGAGRNVGVVGGVGVVVAAVVAAVMAA